MTMVHIVARLCLLECDYSYDQASLTLILTSAGGFFGTLLDLVGALTLA